MPDGSSSAAPVIKPGPRFEKNLRKRPCRTNARLAALAPGEFWVNRPSIYEPRFYSTPGGGARGAGWHPAAGWQPAGCADCQSARSLPSCPTRMWENTKVMSEVLEEKIRTRRARVGIVGRGYVGLPLAVEFAKAGFSVTGIDVSQEKVGRVNAGDSYVGDVPSATLGPLVESGKLRATADFSAVLELDTINICVPT